VLWRIDRSGHETTLFVLSPTQPDLRGLVEEAGWLTSSTPWQTGRMEPLLSRIREGQRWRFRLTANPVVSRRGEGSRRGKVIPLKEGDYLDWVVTRGEANGFDIPLNSLDAREVIVTDRRRLQFAKGVAEGAGRRNVTLATATFDGVLQVTDSDRLKHALTHGIGRGRAYGCGLLTLAEI
jgi:CRISPR system Cascade subunit CasE